MNIAILIISIVTLIMFLSRPKRYGGRGESDKQLTIREALSLEYPWRKLFSTEEQLETAFKLVRSYEWKLVRGVDYKILNIPALGADEMLFEGEKTICHVENADYYTMNWMSDWFNERCRLAGRRYDELQSPLEYWQSHKSDIVKRTHPLTARKLHDNVYFRVKGCNNFRPGLMSGAIKYFNAKSVLDFSSGWGDRLIGAISQGVRYTGVDPNSCLQKGYNEIIARFAGDKSKYTMVEAPFQEYTPTEKYDLVFTSPPYFDLEIYSGAPTQSTETFKSLDSWFEHFLIASLDKSWNALNSGGHMIIIINDIRNKPGYVRDMIRRVNTFTGAEYLGLISYAEHAKGQYQSPQPMWIWRKTAEKTGSAHDDLNPPLVIEAVDRFLVVRDDLLPGGTKQRAHAIISRINENEIVYAGPWNGFAQVALAVSCEKYNKKATVFTTRDDYKTNLRAKAHGCNIVVVKGTLKEIQTAAARYAESRGAHLMPFGFESSDFKRELTARLIERVTEANLREFDKRVWVVAGSATLLNILYSVFPKASFGAIQVGRTVWPDQIDATRTTLYVAPESFYDDAIAPPPYNSALKYDAKAWQFISKHGDKGDLVWNVAGDD